MQNQRGARVSVAGVSKRYPGSAQHALNETTLVVEPGTLFALLGPSGSGKTTLLRLIAGFEKPDTGTVSIDGRIVCGPQGSSAPETRGIGFVFQQSALFPHLSVRKNIHFGIRSLPRREQATVLAEMTELCALHGLLDRYPHELSGGEQQRAALARALARGNRVVLLDEPMSSIDASLRAEMGEQLRGILRQAGTTAILVTHDQGEALVFADEVGVMRAGTIEQVGTPQAVYGSPTNPALGRFLGAANFLPVTVTPERVHTEFCTFSCVTAREHCGMYQAMLRPNEIIPEHDPLGCARVVDVRFTGSTYFYSVALPSGQIVRCEVPAPNHGPIAPGASVKLTPLVRQPLLFSLNDDSARS